MPSVEMKKSEEKVSCPYEDKKVKVRIQKHPVLADAQQIYDCENSQTCVHSKKCKFCSFN